MASQGAIAAAAIGAVGAVAAAVLAVVLPRVLNDPGPIEGSQPGITIEQGGGTQPPITTRTPTRTTIETPPQVEAKLFANKESAPVGATVLVSGQGFAANEPVELLVSAQIVATTRAQKGGDFANVSIKVPDFFKNFAKPMAVTINAVGKTSIKSARLAFTISG